MESFPYPSLPPALTFSGLDPEKYQEMLGLLMKEAAENSRSLYQFEPFHKNIRGKEGGREGGREGGEGMEIVMRRVQTHLFFLLVVAVTFIW